MDYEAFSTTTKTILLGTPCKWILLYVIVIAILGTFLIKELIIDIKHTAPFTNDDVISTVLCLQTTAPRFYRGIKSGQQK